PSHKLPLHRATARAAHTAQPSAETNQVAPDERRQLSPATSALPHIVSQPSAPAPSNNRSLAADNEPGSSSAQNPSSAGHREMTPDRPMGFRHQGPPLSYSPPQSSAAPPPAPWPLQTARAGAHPDRQQSPASRPSCAAPGTTQKASPRTVVHRD